MCENLVWIRWAFQELSFEFSGGRNPLLGGLHVTCDAPFRTWPSYSRQKSCVKILGRIGWVFQELSCPQTFFLGGRNTLLGGVTFDLWSPFSNSDEWFQSKVLYLNLVWIGWNRRYVKFEGGGRPPIRGGYMRPTIPIFELGRGFLDKSDVWKFGSDWLRLSRVIVVTKKKKKKKKNIRGSI